MSSRPVSLLIINYRSAELTRNAVASARSSTSTELQVVVIDNSDDDNLGAIPEVTVHSLERNLGFAGGVNYGLQRCDGDLVVVANPDVIFRRGCIDELAASVGDDVAISGPLLSWDDSGRWLLPPADDPTAMLKVAESSATRSRIVREMWSRARARRRLRFWSNNDPRRMPAISGAVMCLDKNAVMSIGGFDDRFRLYFEEVDLMRRLRKNGRTILYNPRASCRHLYNQSAGQEVSSAAQYMESEHVYHLKWHGARFLRFIQRLAANSVEQADFERWSVQKSITVPEPVTHYVIEASPLPTFDVATGYFPDRATTIFPPEIWQTYRGPTLFLRVMNRRSLRVTAAGRFDKTDKMAIR